MFFRNILVQMGKRALATSAAICAASLAVSAQDAASPAETPSPWLKVCNTDPNTNQEACIISQELRPGGRLIASVTIQSTREEGKYVVQVIVPIRFLIPPGVGLVVDGTEVAKAQYRICIPGSSSQPLAMCLALAGIGEEFITALKKGNTLALVVVNPQGKQIPIEMTLAGFSKTFDGPGVDRAAAQSQREQLSEALQRSAEEARKKLIEQQQKEIGNTQ
jgi:invasion protein IalB